MREATLLKIALLTSVAGLILLFFTLETLPVASVPLSQLRTEDIRKEVLIRGKITDIRDHEHAQTLRLVSDEPFAVTVFRDDAIPVHSGDRVEVRGSMQDFNGSERFLGEEVRVI